MASLSILLLVGGVAALENGLGRTPAMGWNSWNKFACDIDEVILRGVADTVVETGLDKLGYVYVNVDDCWQIDRDAEGYIIEDKRTFPSGMKALADYMHSKGLKFGTYSSAGTYTCQRRPGTLHYEKQDAISYAKQGVDYLKLDNCFNEGLSDIKGVKYRYGKMRDALNATGRPILYSLCSWGEAKVWEYGGELGNSWRTTGDICNKFDRYYCSAMALLDQQIDIVQFSKPGAFNDIDMLEVGNDGMTLDESITHFSAWAALKSPLLLGNDLRDMSPETKAVISNKEVIAINQDPLGLSARLVARDGDADIWIGPLENGDRVVLIINRGDDAINYTLNVELVGGGSKDGNNDGPTKFKARDLWRKKDLGHFLSEAHFDNIPSHASVMLRVSPVKSRFNDIPYPPVGTFKPRRTYTIRIRPEYEVPVYLGSSALLTLLAAMIFRASVAHTARQPIFLE